MSHSFFLSPLIYNYLDIHNQAQVILHSTPGYLRDHPICTFENGWIGPRRKLQSQGSGGIGSGNLAGRGGGGWRKWVGIFPVIHAAAGGTHYSLWGETAVPGEREEENWRECISFYLPWLQQEVRQQTSGAPQLEDHCSGRWAHPKPMC